MTKLLQLQIIKTLLVIELNKNDHDNDVIKFQSTISLFHLHNLGPLICSCYNFYIIKLLFQKRSISIKFSNVLLNVLNPNARINLLLAQTSELVEIT